MKTVTVMKTIPFKKLAGWQSEGKIYLDESFQSNARWMTIDQQLYMSSVMEGQAVTPIVLGDIRAILENLRVAFGEDDEDYLFFKNLSDQGYEYVTIDGNNRARTISSYTLGEFPLTQKQYQICYQGTDIFKCAKDTKYYETLTVDIKTYLDTVPMNILVVTQSTRKGLAELFASVNKGISLNHQEKRNAIMCAFSERVRGLVSKNKKEFRMLFTDNQINRRFADEMVVKTAFICSHGATVPIETISNATLDNAYNDKSPELRALSSHVESIIDQILKKMVGKYGKGGLKAGDKFLSTFIDLVMLMKYMKDQSVVIDDYKGFYNWFAETQAERCSSDEVLYKGSDGTNLRTYAGLLRSSSKTFLNLRYGRLVESLGNIPDGIVTWRDKDRLFDPKKRYAFWKRQKGICPLTLTSDPGAAYIEPRFIFNGTMTHIDHRIPWSKGGGTGDDNGQLVFASANLAKSDSIKPQEVGSL